MAVAHVQAVGQAGSTSTVTSLALTIPTGHDTTKGNHLILSFGGNVTLTGVTDTQGNIWNVDVADGTNARPALASCYLNKALTHGSTDSITATFASGTRHVFNVDEFSGLDPGQWFGSSSAVSSGSSGSPTTNSVTAGAGDLVFAVWACTTSPGTLTPGSGYSAIATEASTYAVTGEWQVDSGSGGSYTPGGTFTSVAWRGISAIYKAAGAVLVQRAWNIDAINTASEPTSLSTLAVTTPKSVTAGNLLVVVVSWASGSAATLSVSDNQTQTWHQIGSTVNDTTNHQYLAAFYCFNAKSGSTTVTAATTVAQGWARVTVAEYSGVKSGSDPLDQHTVTTMGTTSTSSNGNSCGPITPTQNNSLVWACVIDDSSGTGWTKDTANFHEEGQVKPTTGVGASIEAEYFVQGAEAAVTAHWTDSVGSGVYNAIVASFLPASVANTQTITGTQAEALTAARAAAAKRSFAQGGAFSMVRAPVAKFLATTQSQLLALVKAPGKLLATVTQGSTASETRQAGKIETASQGQAFSFGAKALSIYRSFTQTQAWTVTRAVVKTPLLWAQASAGAILRGAGKLLSVVTQGASGSASRQGGKLQSSTQAETATLPKRAVSAFRSWTQSEAFAESRAVSAFRSVTQSQAYTQSLQKMKNVALAFTQGSSAAISRAVAIIRAFTQSQAWTLTKAVVKAPFSWAQGSTASESRQAGKQQTVAQSEAGTFKRAVSAFRAWTQTEGLSLMKAVVKSPLTVGQASAGALKRGAGKFLSIAQGEAGVETRSSGKNISATQTEALTEARGAGKLETVTQTETALEQRGTGKTQLAAQAQAGVYRRAVAKVTAWSQSETPSLQRAVSKFLVVVAQASSAVMTPLKNGGMHAYTQTLSFTQTQAATLVKGASAFRSWTQAQAGALARAAAHLFTSSQSQAGSQGKQDTKAENATQLEVYSASRSTRIIRAVTQSQAFTSAHQLGRGVVLAFTQAASATYSRGVGKLQAAAQSETPSFQRNLAKGLLVAQASTASFVKGIGRVIGWLQGQVASLVAVILSRYPPTFSVIKVSPGWSADVSAGWVANASVGWSASASAEWEANVQADGWTATVNP